MAKHQIKKWQKLNCNIPFYFKLISQIITFKLQDKTQFKCNGLWNGRKLISLKKVTRADTVVFLIFPVFFQYIAQIKKRPIIIIANFQLLNKGICRWVNLDNETDLRLCIAWSRALWRDASPSHGMSRSFLSSVMWRLQLPEIGQSNNMWNCKWKHTQVFSYRLDFICI